MKNDRNLYVGFDDISDARTLAVSDNLLDALINEITSGMTVVIEQRFENTPNIEVERFSNADEFAKYVGR